jgi:hypothetical protein
MIPNLDSDDITASKFAKQVPLEIARLLLDLRESPQHRSLGIDDRGSIPCGTHQGTESVFPRLQ